MWIPSVGEYELHARERGVASSLTRGDNGAGGWRVGGGGGGVTGAGARVNL